MWMSDGTTVVACMCLVLLLLPAASTSASHYHSYAELAALLLDVENRTRPSGLCTRFSLGSSVLGRELYAMRITSAVNDTQRPEIRLAAQIHGNEAVGRELLLDLVELLCGQYEVGTRDNSITRRVRALVDSTHIYIVPSLNPDGHELGTRHNANHYDLNRNFPDERFPARATRPVQPETRALMKFSLAHQFALCATFHGGSLVANYPFDGSAQVHGHTPAPTVDDALFQRLASSYANAHPKMRASEEFPGGITNGAQWYVLYGGLQDWNYLSAGCPEVTLEVSEVKRPAPELLPGYWQDNWRAILSYIEQVHSGRLQVTVEEETTGMPLGAKLTIRNEKTGQNHTCDGFGVLHCLLASGTYAVTCNSGHQEIAPVRQIKISSERITTLNIQITRQ